MKYEKINKKYTNIIIISLVVIIIGSALVLNITKAKYKTTVSVPIVSGTVNYSGGNADLNVVAMYKPENDEEDDVSKWISIDEAPGNAYTIDENQTKCTIGGKYDTSNQIKIGYDGTSVTVTGLTKPKTKCNIYFVKKVIARDVILDNSSVIYDTPDFSKTACATCGDNKSGLYETEDDFGTSYYFRGTVNDNWVKFGKAKEEDGTKKDIWWRIVRINGDGTIRLIYAGTGDSAPSTTGSQTSAIINQKFNESSNDNMYVGYQYKSGDMHGYGKGTTNSNVLDSLNTWFKENLNDEWKDGYGRIDPNAGFCNDRSGSTDPGTSWNEKTMSDTGGTENTETYYGSFLRWSKIQPNLKCSTTYNKNKDYFTYAKSIGIESNENGKIIGTQSLDYPVGLITADEVAFAGAANGKANSGFWLNTGQEYWTMSPDYFDGGISYVFYVGKNGTLYHSIHGLYGLRPVINLKADTKLTFLHPDQADKGTNSNPYIVK